MSIKSLVVGIIIGVTIVGIAWAAQGIVLVNGSGNEVGTTASPLYVQAV